MSDLETKLEKSLTPLQGALSPSQDDAIRALARSAGQRIRKQKSRRWLAPAAAIAIAAALLIGVLWNRDRSTVSFAASDFNRDGVVDVVDAYALHLSIKQKAPLAAGDVTGDQSVTYDDVDSVVMKIVRGVAP